MWCSSLFSIGDIELLKHNVTPVHVRHLQHWKLVNKHSCLATNWRLETKMLRGMLQVSNRAMYLAKFQERKTMLACSWHLLNVIRYNTLAVGFCWYHCTGLWAILKKTTTKQYADVLLLFFGFKFQERKTMLHRLNATFFTLWPFILYIAFYRFHALPKSQHWFVAYNAINSLRILGDFQCLWGRIKWGRRSDFKGGWVRF